MKIKQTVTAKFHNAYTGWNSLQFHDEAGDEIEIQMTDDNYLQLADTLKTKADRIRKERQEEAEEAARALAKENEDNA